MIQHDDGDDDDDDDDGDDDDDDDDNDVGGDCGNSGYRLIFPKRWPARMRYS
jgi:hypothetical protein